MKKILIPIFAAIAASAAAAVPPHKTFRDEMPIRQTANWTTNWWPKRFAVTCAAASNANVKVVFLGDSIIHNWESKGASVWKKHFATGEFAGVNCGFSGDCTEHVLWRLENGQVDGCTNAPALVLMIGTNNTHLDRSRPGAIVRGIRKIIATVQKKMPKTRIVLLPIFPRGAQPTEGFRRNNDTVNREIRRFADGKKVIWLDFTGTMVDEKGVLTKETAKDLLHPEAPTYQIWADRLIPVLKDIYAGKEVIEPVAESACTALPPTGFEMPVQLWPEGKTPDNAIDKRGSEIYFFDPLEVERPSKACIIIASGGGYSGCDPKSNEAWGAGQNFLACGLHVILLRYRTVRIPYKPVHWSAFQDAQRAIRLAKEYASSHGYETNNVSFCGYSAGGHLTLMAATCGMTESYKPVDEIDRKWNTRLRHAVPVYAAYVCGWEGPGKRGTLVDTPISTDFKFDAWTPSMTLIHGDEDGHTAMAAVKVYTELRRRNLRASVFIFAGMNHGFGGTIRSSDVIRRWPYGGWELHVANTLVGGLDIHRWPDEDYSK